LRIDTNKPLSQIPQTTQENQGTATNGKARGLKSRFCFYNIIMMSKAVDVRVRVL
jgi:hypothetical protein